MTSIILEEPTEILKKEITISELNAKLYGYANYTLKLLLLLFFSLSDINWDLSLRDNRVICILEDLLNNLFDKKLQLSS